jgi:hypothetical protein
MPGVFVREKRSAGVGEEYFQATFFKSIHDQPGTCL